MKLFIDFQDKMPKKCACESCCFKVAMIVGHCKYCNADFCLKHRLPEPHICAESEACSKSAKEQLVRELMTNATHNHKRNHCNAA